MHQQLTINIIQLINIVGIRSHNAVNSVLCMKCFPQLDLNSIKSLCQVGETQVLHDPNHCSTETILPIH